MQSAADRVLWRFHSRLAVAEESGINRVPQASVEVRGTRS
jgi:hypothetical protein